MLNEDSLRRLVRASLHEGVGTKYDLAYRLRDKLDPAFVRTAAHDMFRRRQRSTRRDVVVDDDITSVSDDQYDHRLSDAILDWAADNVDPQRRDATMRRVHVAGQKACEVCGKALKPGHAVIGGISIGPECLRRLRRDGIVK